MKNPDLQVLVFCERWLSVGGPHVSIDRVASLGRAVQLAVDQWESGNPITDSAGRIVAPAQHAPAPRPDGPYDDNADARRKVTE